jgi:uncharacterized membrane protein (UPF0127 family)
MSELKQLLAAKAHSDKGQYEAKAAMLRKLIAESPKDFMVDSRKGGIYGLTHIPTGFRIHLPKIQVDDLLKAASAIFTVPLLVKGAAVHAEMADTPELQSKGLGGRESLPDDHGMLFTEPNCFWMKDALFPIDLVPLTKRGEVLGYYEMPVEADPRSPAAVYPMPVGANLALELPGGWCAKHALKKGDAVVVNTR